jgi:hypothetical protein
MSHPGRFRQRVNTYARDAACPHEAGGGIENTLAIFGSLFFRNAHVRRSRVTGLDNYNGDRYLYQ